MSSLIEKNKAHYEMLPYPPRHAEDEKNRLIRTTGDNLQELNHVAFQGLKNYSEGFRCLVAGGGTGDSVIYLAEQLKHTQNEIVYLDMSESSLNIAKARAEVRGFENITWIQESILDMDKLSLGKFDYINCSGVLHHLPEPGHGLKQLVTHLDEQGVIFLMLYAHYGRQAIYLLQDILRKIIPEQSSIQDKIKVCRNLINHLSEYNLFKREQNFWQSEINDDSGLYDLLLHAVDRAYTIDELYNFISTEKMKLLQFVGDDAHHYKVDTFIHDDELSAFYQDMPEQQQYAVAEKIYGKHIKHKCYIAKNYLAPASLDNRDLALILVRDLEGKQQEISDAMTPGENLKINFENNDNQVVLQCNEVNKMIVRYLNGQHSISSIINLVRQDLDISDESAIFSEIEKIYQALHQMRWLYLQVPGSVDGDFSLRSK